VRAILEKRSLQIAGVAACVAGLLAAAIVWKHTWDDSAITLGYSRNLALTGEVRFGKFGERVEGCTTFLWMIVGAGICELFQQPERVLDATKVACAGLYLLNAFLLDRLARALGLSLRGRAVMVVLFALSAISIVSIADAMENHLFLFLHLAAALLWIRLRRGSAGADPWLLGLVMAGLLLCRPEGVFVGLALLVAIPFESPDAHRRAFVVRILGALSIGAVAFGALLLWRHQTFGVLVTNSVLAKRWTPYSATGAARITGGLRDIAHFFVAAVLPLAPFGLAAAAMDAPSRARLLRALRAVARENVAFVVCIACYVAFFFVTGVVSGTKNRVVLSVIPFVWCLLGAAYERASIVLTPRLTRVAVASAVVLFAGAQGLYFFRYVTMEVTVDNILNRASPVAELARLSGDRAPWRIALPDVGGPLLWWGEKVELVDTALLNETASARSGWGALQPVLFDRNPPDAILTHDLWTPLAGLDHSEYFHAHYAKVRINDQLVFLRDDRIHALVAAPPSQVTVDEAGPMLAGIRDDTLIDEPCVLHLTVPGHDVPGPEWPP
jgi:hypothetical protein